MDAATPKINTPGALANGWLNAEEAKVPMKLTGTAGAGDTVKLSIGGFALPDVKAQANGTWEASVPVSVLGRIADGANKEITASAVTAQGGTSTGASKVSFSVDKTPPGQPSNIKANGNDLDINAQEAQSGKAQFSGDAPGGATKVTVNWNGQTHDAQVNNGKWTTEFDSLPPVATGGTAPAKVTVVAYDAANNKSVTAEQTITVHSGVPQQAGKPTIDAVSKDDLINAAEAAKVAVTGSADPGSTVTLSVNGVAQAQPIKVDGTGKWSTTIDISKLADGAIKLSATASKDGGPASAESDRTVKLDKTPPTLSSITADDGTDITAEEAANGVTFSGTTEEGSTLSGTWNGKPIPDFQAGPGGTWQFVVNASDMPKPAAGTTANATFSVTATDAAGNKSAAPVSLQVTVHGGVAPLGATTIKGPLTDDNIINSKEDDKISVSGTAQAGANIELRADTAGGKVLGTGKAGANGQWTIDNVGLSDEKLLPDGPHKLVAVATITGNPGTSTVEHTFNIDRVVDLPKVTSFNGHPSDVITDTERKNGIVLAGTGEPNSTLSLRLGDELQAGIPVNGAGNWTSKEFTKIPEASTGGSQPYTYTFTTATDAADNTQTGLGSGKITVQGPTQTPTPAAPAPNPTGPRSTTASSLTTDDESSVASSPDNTGAAATGTAASGTASAGAAGTGSAASAGAATATSPATGSSADNATDATASGAAGTTSATPGTSADTPASTGPTVAGKSLSSSGTTAHAGNHGSSKLALSDLLDQGSHDMPDLQGAPSAGQSVVSTAAASSSAAVTSTTAGAGETGSTIVSNPVATVNTLLASQQPWEHQPTV